MSTDESSNQEKVKDPPASLCKKVENENPETKCALCTTGTVDPDVLGELYQIENVTCHYYCLLLSSSLVQNGEDHEGILGFLSKDILKEVRRGSRLKCSYCKQKGATIGCTVKACRKMFHLPCGLKMGSMHQYFNQFLSFCSSHRPEQKVSAKFKTLLKVDEDAKICPICYESVGNCASNDTLWAPCCQKRWFHRLCLQRQALAQGYFFKCPMCNNKDKFNVEMKQFGIYIPEMDAAWEREPQAYQDLLHTHKMCDATKCQCPDGRPFAQNTGSWRLLRCNSCGSQGTHIICSGLKMTASTNSWRCSLCSSIFNKGKGRGIRDYFVTRSTSSSSSSRPDSPPSPPCPSPTPSTSSGSATISSSQRRSAVDVSFEQDRKRRRSSPDVTKGTNNPEQAAQDTLPGPSGPSESNKNNNANEDEDEIVIVDDESDNDIEVLDIEKPKTALRTYPVSSELLTREGKTIKVHKVSAEGHTSPLEIGSLGAVNMRHTATAQEPRPQSMTVSPKPKSRKTVPSSSMGSTQLHIQNGCSTSKPSSTFDTNPNSQSDGSLGIKIGDVRHSDELFCRKEDSAEKKTETTLTQAHLLDIVNKANIPVPKIYFLPVTTNGQTTIQPYISVNAIPVSLQQQLVQAQHQRQMAKDKAPASPDVVTLE